MLNYDPGVYTRQRVAGGSLARQKHTLQPLRHWQARSCARYPISSQYFYSQILRSLVACLVMSAYTRSVNTRAHTCTRQACVQSHDRVVATVPSYRDTRGQSIGPASMCAPVVPCMRSLCCIRAIGPIGGRPVDFISTPYHRPYLEARGREKWWGVGSLFPPPPSPPPDFFFFFFFLPFFFYRPSGFHRCGFFCAAFASPSRRDVLLFLPCSVTKTTTAETVSSAAFLCLRFFTFAFLPPGISFRFSGFCFSLRYSFIQLRIYVLFLERYFLFRVVKSQLCVYVRYTWYGLKVAHGCLIREYFCDRL